MPRKIIRAESDLKYMKDSTKGIIKMHGLRIDRALHHYLYLKYYDIYVKYFYLSARSALPFISSFKFTSMALKGVFERFHARVLSRSEAQRILTLDENISFDDETSKRIVPFRYAYNILLQNPRTIAVVDCPCRKAFGGNSGDLNVCICVGNNAMFWLEHGKRLNVRKINQKEALEIVERERSKGSITTAWFKVATGGRSGVICSCHPDFCVGMRGMLMAKDLKYSEGVNNHAPSGYTISIDDKLCSNCEKCISVCHFKALAASVNTPLYDRKSCFGCGLCAESCPNSAVTMMPDPDRPIALDIEIDKVCLKRNGGAL
jgi:ferredoxin